MSGLPSPEDMSHAMLLAILMHNGGSYELPLSAFEHDAIEGPNGFHAVMMVESGPGMRRLYVVPRPPGRDSVLRVEPVEPPPVE